MENQEQDLELEQELEAVVEENQKTAMSRWKAENPHSSLKAQRQLLEKDSELDRETGNNTDQEIHREIKYLQNSEQGSSTIWQKLKVRSNDR